MSIAGKIDHTMLKADATKETIERYCKEALQHGFASVCANGCHAALVSRCLNGSDVKVCCVIGFPLGAMATKAKAFEAKTAVEDGADEIDMVINIGAMKEMDYDFVTNDIKAVVDAVFGKAIVKVILETCLLTDEEIKAACDCALKAGAHFVKTSTGFSTGGATIEDIALMKEQVKDKAKVKASGGIRTKEQAEALIQAGADRIGAGNGVILL